MSTKSYTGRITGTQLTTWGPGKDTPSKMRGLRKSAKLHQTITGTVKQAVQRIALNYLHECTTAVRLCDTATLFIFVELWPSQLFNKGETWCVEYRIGDKIPRNLVKMQTEKVT